MRHHTSPLVMLGFGVQASCHSQARTILLYCASIESTVTYAKRCCIVGVFGSPGLLVSGLGSCAPLLHWRIWRDWPVPSVYVDVVPSSGLSV